MKSVIQIVALFGILVGGVFLVTFLTQFSPKPATSAQPAPPDGSKELLKRWERTGVWDPADPAYVREVEKGVAGHYDFLVSNANDKPVVLTLNSKSCKCASVKFAVLSEANRQKLKDVASPPMGTLLEPYVADAAWSELLRDRDQAPVTAKAPAADAAGPQFAVIRLGWDGKKDPQPMTLSADLQAQMGSAADYLHFEVPIIIAPPLGASDDKLDFGELNPGEARDRQFFVWSATRERVAVTADLATADPCIKVSEPRPLTADELKKLPDELVAAGKVSSRSRPKCGYAVTVNVAESRGENQLELGPLARRLYVNRGTDTEVTIQLTGTVRGAIQVGEPGDHDRIDLRVFPAALGMQKMVVVRSALPGLALTVDHVKPVELQAAIVAGSAGSGTRQWKLTVTAPPNALAGPMPPDSAIYLKTNTTPPRRVRIPVSGNASG